MQSPAFREGAPLHMAARLNDTRMLDLLVAAGADVSLSVFPFGTPLHIAAAKGLTEIAHVLVAAGADPNVGDGYGFFWACCCSTSYAQVAFFPSTSFQSS